MNTISQSSLYLLFEKIKHFFDQHIAIQTSETANEQQLRVASAALFMEMMHSEEIYITEKRHLILEIIENQFCLAENQATSLMEIAEHKRKHATDYFEFTHLIRDSYNHSQRCAVIEALWRIALLDNHLDIEEEYLVDKVARLLLIQHVEVLRIKNKIHSN